jgi:hypothetical protein
MDTARVSPAGDPFHAAPHDQDRPHACLNGYSTSATQPLMRRRAKRSSGSRRYPAAAAPKKLDR